MVSHLMPKTVSKFEEVFVVKTNICKSGRSYMLISGVVKAESRFLEDPRIQDPRKIFFKSRKILLFITCHTNPSKKN